MVQQGSHSVRLRQQGRNARKNLGRLTGEHWLAVEADHGLPVDEIRQASQQVRVQDLAIEKESLIFCARMPEFIARAGLVDESLQIQGNQRPDKKFTIIPDDHQGRFAARIQKSPRLFIVQITEGFVQPQGTVGTEDHALPHIYRAHRPVAGHLADKQVVDVFAGSQRPRLFHQKVAQLLHRQRQTGAGLAPGFVAHPVMAHLVHRSSNHEQQNQTKQKVPGQKPFLESWAPGFSCPRDAVPHHPVMELNQSEQEEKQDQVQEHQPGQVQKILPETRPPQAQKESFSRSPGRALRQEVPLAQPGPARHRDFHQKLFSGAKVSHQSTGFRSRESRVPRFQPAGIVGP